MRRVFLPRYACHPLNLLAHTSYRPKNPDQKLSQSVESVFRDARGKFNDIKVEILRTRPEDDPYLSKEPEVEPVEPKDDVAVTVGSGKMSFLEMAQMKTELAAELG